MSYYDVGKATHISVLADKVELKLTLKINGLQPFSYPVTNTV
jgi:hypothetical protein